jgi:hypothetical protein
MKVELWLKDLAMIRPFSSVNSQVGDKVGAGAKGFLTFPTSM